MRYIFFILMFVGMSASVVSQTYSALPRWVTQLPEPSNETYYYRVTHAEANTYEKAYAKAFATAILESSWKLGVTVDTKNDIHVLEKGITENINVAETQMVLPLNKVCEYVEKPTTSRNVKIYILWQVARYGNMSPLFDDFRDCR